MKKSLYPRSADQLAAYLTQHPVVNLKLPTKNNILTFRSCDGIRINFIDVEGHLINFACSGSLCGNIEYNEDGFTRTLGPITAWYYYTGPKPWQTAKPEWKQKIEDWDGVLEGLKDFAD